LYSELSAANIKPAPRRLTRIKKNISFSGAAKWMILCTCPVRVRTAIVRLRIEAAKSLRVCVIMV